MANPTDGKYKYRLWAKFPLPKTWTFRTGTSGTISQGSAKATEREWDAHFQRPAATRTIAIAGRIVFRRVG